MKSAFNKLVETFTDCGGGILGCLAVIVCLILAGGIAFGVFCLEGWVLMLLWNWLITPLYMGYPRSAVEAMLIPYFLPFNALKAGLNTALTMVLYKPVVNTLRKTGLLEQRAHAESRSKVGVYLFVAALLATCVIALLVLRGVL